VTSHPVELVMTGQELTSGIVADANSAFACRSLEAAGMSVGRITVVGDHQEDIVQALHQAARAPFVIVSGGLGPTEDDRTAAAAADLTGGSLEMNETALAGVRQAFQSMGRTMAPINEKQALLPVGATVLPNPIGTAPGFEVQAHDSRLFFLPGVPREFRRMLTDEVIPRIQPDDAPTRVTRIIKVYGYGESRVAQALAGLRPPAGITVGWRPDFPEIHLHLYGQGDAEKALADATATVEEHLGIRVISTDGRSLPEVLGDLLKARGWKLALAESCTGGLLGTLLTDASGSSQYLDRGFVTYSNQAKQDLLNVPEGILEAHGAVSSQTAQAMASGALAASQADMALAVTGIAGPTGGTPDKPVGTVHIARATATSVESRELHLPGDRAMVRRGAAWAAMDLGRRCLLDMEEQA
jgi:nicotinamide-nucleotide amidase